MAVNLKTALGPNFPGQFVTAWMPWTGDPSRQSHDTGYKQTDSGVADQQAECARAAGFDGFVLFWQGPTKTFTHAAFMQMFYACVKRQMPIMVGLDQWIAKNQPNPTQSTIDALRSPAFQTILPLLAENWILEFSLADPLVKVDVAAVRAALPNLNILSKHVGYSWIETSNTIPTLKAENGNPLMKVPGVFAKFNDGGYPLPNGVGSPSTFKGQRDYNRSVWGGGPTRIVAARGGKTYLESCTAVPAGAKYALYQTWNDYDEGTQVEEECVRGTGIKIGL